MEKRKYKNDIKKRKWKKQKDLRLSLKFFFCFSTRSGMVRTIILLYNNAISKRYIRTFCNVQLYIYSKSWLIDMIRITWIHNEVWAEVLYRTIRVRYSPLIPCGVLLYGEWMRNHSIIHFLLHSFKSISKYGMVSSKEEGKKTQQPKLLADTYCTYGKTWE